MVAAKPGDGTTRSVPVTAAAALDAARLRAGALGRRFAVADLLVDEDPSRSGPCRHPGEAQEGDAAAEVLHGVRAVWNPGDVHV
ncbi:MAG: hypothetical protein ACRD0N_13530, partial [Acidimicrobiales bacterium]